VEFGFMQRHGYNHNLPAPLYSSEQVRDLDRRIIEAGTPGWILMQRAARAAYAAMLERWPQVRSLCVFCGRGNNGGDGFLVARLAVDRGLSVSVIQVGFENLESRSAAERPVEQDVSKLTDAQRAREACLATGAEPLNWSDDSADSEIATLVASADLVVDAMLGTGMSGEPRREFCQAIDLINRCSDAVLSVDMPSGLGSDTGNMLGEYSVIADMTVTFIGLKKGQFTGEARGYTGEIIFDDLQADKEILDSHPGDASLCQLASLTGSFPHRPSHAFKNSSGHLLVIGGNEGMGGAPLLAASAAIRCGAGLVSVATRPENTVAIIACQPELMAKGIEKTQDILPLIEKADAVVIGPGLGQDVWAQQLLVHCLSYLLETRQLPLLLDADALNLIASKPEIAQLFEEYRNCYSGSAVLTPHPGEAYRLLGRKVADRYEVMKALLESFESTIVVKGAGTLIGEGDQVSVCPYGNPCLATAGSGDVLSGVIGSLMAQGVDAFKAAELGVCLHAAAADHYLAEYGSKGMTAGDLPVLLAEVLNNLVGGDE